jgi:hypothetical protein
MATITYDSGRVITVPATETTAGPSGAAGTRPVFATNSESVLKFVVGLFSFDNSYPTGGEDISDIFNQFRSLKGFLIEDPVFSTGTGKNCRVDYSGKKLLLFDNAAAPAQVLNATDQSNAASLRFVAWGT